MKLKTIALICVLLVTALAASTVRTLAEILTFDDLPDPGNGDLILNGYAGLNWSEFDYLNGFVQVPSGYNNAVLSGNNVAFNAGGSPGEISGRVFDLNSAYLTAAWNDGLHVEVQGFVGATLTYDNTYTLNTAGPTLVTFNYLGVDHVNFISSGGTHNPAYTSGMGTQFAMDNLSITVPEPSTLALTGLGVIALLGFCRQRRIRHLA